MSDLISRQAAIDALDERCESECEYSKKQRSVMCNACYLGSAKEVIEGLPTIEPFSTSGYVTISTDEPPVVYAEQKRGKWIPVDEKNDAFDCSECDMMVQRRYNYCPNCGAKMMRGDDED